MLMDVDLVCIVKAAHLCYFLNAVYDIIFCKLYKVICISFPAKTVKIIRNLSVKFFLSVTFQSRAIFIGYFRFSKILFLNIF